MKPTDMLMCDHQIILRVIATAEKEVAHIRNTGDIHLQTVREITDFLLNFVDRCHHAKEEQHLFAIMYERGMPLDAGPLAVMRQHHDKGRAHAKALAEALATQGSLSAAAIASVKDNLSNYAALLRAHIDKEDSVLYRLANRLMNDTDQNVLAAAFERVEKGLGTGACEKYRAWSNALPGLPAGRFYAPIAVPA